MHASRSKFAFVIGFMLAAVPAIGSAGGWRTVESTGLLTPFGEYFLLGGGVTDFTEDAVKDSFDVGGTWDVRLGFGSRFYVGGELAYVGSFLSADRLGSDLVNNGAEAVLRLQYPYVKGDWLVEPFAFGGIGWSHLSLDDAGPGLKDSDDIGVVPFGAGLTAGYKHFLFDARFTYRATFDDEDLVLSTDGTRGDLQNWAVTASVGYEF